MEGFRGQIYTNIFKKHNQYLYLKYLTSWNYHLHLVLLRHLGSPPLPCSDLLNCMFLGTGSALSCLSCEVPKRPLTPKRTKKTWRPVYWCCTVYMNGHFFVDAVCRNVWFLRMWEVYLFEMSICLHCSLVVAVMAYGLCPWFTSLQLYLLIRLVTRWNAPLEKL